jgi:hypothetical protein
VAQFLVPDGLFVDFAKKHQRGELNLSSVLPLDQMQQNWHRHSQPAQQK